jgi:hypothetical protein
MTLRTHHHEHHPASRSPAMKLNPRSVYTAVAISSGFVYTVCVLFVVLAPIATTNFLGYVLHANLWAITRSVTWGSFIVGLLFWSLGLGLHAALVSRFYNNFASR